MARKRLGLRAVVTTAPDPPAPTLDCPVCTATLTYKKTILGGVQPRERWDYLECRTCGPFEYRHRTRHLRPTVELR
jgi:transcription elongation factor Elf1